MSDNADEFVGSEPEDSGDSIRVDMENVLASKQKYTPWSFTRDSDYLTAPCPKLCIGEVDVTLPLRDDTIENVKRVAGETSGTGEGGVRIVDGSLVSLDPSWDRFTNELMTEVCEIFDIDMAKTRPVCQLKKLVLYGPGSRTLPRSDELKDDHTFATIQVTLPSTFTGAATRLCHDSLTAVFDTSPRENRHYFVSAWFNGVTYETTTLTEGHKLVLIYDVAKTTRTPLPIPPSYSSLISRLDSVFQQWKTKESSKAQDKLLCLLDHSHRTRAEIPVKASSLQGEDEVKFAIISSVAGKHGLKVGFANLTLFEYGKHYVDEDGPIDLAGPIPRGSLQMQEMTVDSFVDVDSNEVQEEPMSSESPEVIDEYVIPGRASELLLFSKHDVHEDELWGNAPQVWCLKRWYHRTVLVIWSYRDELSWEYPGPRGFKQAMYELSGVQSPSPAPQQVALAKWAASQAKDSDRCASETLFGLAVLWKEVDLCREILNGVPLEMKFQALKIFGFDAVAPSLEKAIKTSYKLSQRLEIICAILSTMNAHEAQGQYYGRDIMFVKSWINTQTKEALVSLLEATPADSAALLSIAHDAGGTLFIAQQLLDGLVSQNDEFLLNVTVALHADGRFPPSAEKKALVSRLMTATVSRALQVDAFSFGFFNEKASFLSLRPYIDACFTTHCQDALAPIVDRLIEKMNSPSARAQQVAAQDIIPFAAYGLERSEGRSFPGVRLLQEVGVPRYLDSLCHSSRTQATPNSLDARAASLLLRVAVVDGSPDLLMNTVVPAMESAELPALGIKVFTDELQSQSGRLVFPPEYDGRTLYSVISAFAQSYLESVDLETSESIIDTLEWLTRLELSELANQLLERLTDRKNIPPHRLSNALLSALPRLKEWAVRHGRVDALRTTFQTVFSEWLHRVLGKEPKTSASFNAKLAGLSGWTCTCEMCLRARTFISQSTAKVLRLDKIGATARKHVEQEVRGYAHSLVTCETVGTTPQGVQLRKSEMMTKFTCWRTEKLRGRAVFARLGNDEAELRFLLGEEYELVKEALSEPPAALMVAAAPPMAQPTASSYSFQTVSFPPAITSAAPKTQGRKGRPSKKRRVA